MKRPRPPKLLAACALVAGASLLPLPAFAAASDGTTGEDDNRYLTGTVIWTQDHRYDDWGPNTSLNVGTGAGEGHLSVQDGARVEVAGALFIAGKGYGSPYSIEQGHDGLVSIGPGSTLECGSQAPSHSGGHIYVGWGSGVQGTLRVDGGELISNYMLHVGCHEDSHGLLELLHGGRVTLGLSELISGEEAAFLSIATSAESQGLLRVDGQSVLEFSVGADELTRADIGTGGHGTLLIEGSSRVSLGKDFALIGVESTSDGLVHVRGASRLELPGVTYMARDEGSRGSLVVEGEGSRLLGQTLSVGEGGEGSVLITGGAEAEFSGPLAVGIRTGSGRVDIQSGARLSTADITAVGSRGSLHLAEGARWQSSGSVAVSEGGTVSLSGSSRWEAEGAVTFQPGSTLSFVVDSLERAPELTVASGALLTLAEDSRLQLTLSSELLAAAAGGESLVLPLITGEFVNEGYEYELRDESGLFDSSGLRQLSDGRWGLNLSLDSAALRDSLAEDAARVANALWSAGNVMQDYTSALFHRPYRTCGRNIWGMGLGSFTHMSSQGNTPGYDFNGGGYALGADTHFQAGRSSLGISFGQLYGTNKSADGLARIRQNSLMGSLYARYDSHAGQPGRRMVLDAYAAYGRVHNHGRSSLPGIMDSRGSGSWSDDVYALGIRASWERPLSARASLLPFVALRYIHASHGGFGLGAGELSRRYTSATLRTLSLPIGFTLRSCYSFGNNQQLLPELTLAYVWDMSRGNPRLHSSMLGESALSSGAAPGRHAFMLRPGAHWVMNEHWSSGLYYHLECRNHEVNQGVDISVSYSF